MGDVLLTAKGALKMGCMYIQACVFIRINMVKKNQDINMV